MHDMPRKKLFGVCREKSRHGRKMWFYREGKGKRTRLPDNYGSPEFMEAYKRAVAGDTKPMESFTTRKGAWSWMVYNYLESRAFLELADSTKKQRRKLLQDAAKKAGKNPPESVTEGSIQRVMMSRPPHAANNFLKALRGFYTWAIAMGHIPRDQNPTIHIKPNSVKGDGWVVWSDELMARFRTHWSVGTLERRAFELLYQTGLRVSDVVKASRFHDKGDVIEITAQKNKVTCYIPVTDELRKLITESTNAILLERDGKPFNTVQFGQWFNKACLAADIPKECRSHSMRKTAATHDAENGRSTHWLMSKYGWTKMAEAERYTKKADRKRIVTEKVRDGAGKNLLGSIGLKN